MFLLAELDEVVDRVAAHVEGRTGPVDGATLVAELDGLHRNLNVLAAAKLRLEAAAAGSGVWAADGAVSAASWLANRYGLSGPHAASEIRAARHLLAMPATWSALRSGEITEGHARILVAAHRFAPEPYEADEDTLVEHARGLRVDQLARVLTRWRALVDPDGALDEANDAHGRRRFSASATFDGATVVDGTFYGDDGVIVRRALDAYVEAMRLDEQGCPEAPRTLAQMRADAEVEIHQAALAALAGHTRSKRIRPHLMVSADVTDLGDVPSVGGAAEVPDAADATGTARPTGTTGPTLDGYGPILRTMLARLGCDADVAVLVTTAGSEPLALGRSQRLVSLAQRRVIDHRDRHCRFPGCDRPSHWCDAHHIRTWHGDQGPTDTWNLVLLCRHHHRLLHEGRHRAVHDFDGASLRFHRPDGTLIGSIAWPAIQGRHPPPEAPAG